MSDIKVIFEPTSDKPYIVIYKPKGLPSAPLTKEDKENALIKTAEIYPEVYNVNGRKDIEYGLLHRLDTATDGLLVIATTQKSYDFILNEQKEGRFSKFYKAKCTLNPNNKDMLDGFPPYVDTSFNKGDIINAISYFRPFGSGKKEVRPVTNNCGKAALKKIGKLKEYKTNITILEKGTKKCIVECKIQEGYRHQVRCHLAWVGLPIEGDDLYNGEYRAIDKKIAENEMKFSATKIIFEYPRGDLNSYEIAFTWT